MIKYVLILTMTFHIQGNKSAAGGASVSQQEYNNLQACENAGQYWKNKLVPTKDELTRAGRYHYIYKDYVCAPKGVE